MNNYVPKYRKNPRGPGWADLQVVPDSGVLGWWWNGARWVEVDEERGIPGYDWFSRLPGHPHYPGHCLCPMHEPREMWLQDQIREVAK